MKTIIGPRCRRSEAGIVLLIVIFVLLLIGVTTIALIIAASTESSLAGNYRSSAVAHYAALAGLEEARGRLLTGNPDYLAGIMPPPGTPLALGNVIYIINPLPGETVNPTDATNPYFDREYGTEFAGTPYATPAVLGGGPVNSVSPVAGLPGPFYKWARVNAVTEKALKIDVNGDAFLDPNVPLYYDSSCLDHPGSPGPSLCLNPSPNAVQALEITALSALPGGTQKLLQYIVAPGPLLINFGGAGSTNPNLAGALTLIGNNVSFQGPASLAYQINGNDQLGVGGCLPTASSISAIAYSNGSDSSLSNILNGIPPSNAAHYSGAGSASPNVALIPGIPPAMQTPSGLDSLVQSITASADDVIAGPATQHNLSPAMSASNPMTVVVNGDFSFSAGANPGYGVLLVTGTFTYIPNDSNASWYGLVLVIGKGNFISTTPGTGAINGAVVVAQTRDANGNLLPDPNLGAASFIQSGGGLGVSYSSCWLKTVLGAQKPASYKVLSYHELSQ